MSQSPSPSPSSAAAVILAAGKGTRMNSDLPKVVHPVAGRPMVWWVVRACREAGIGRIVVVIGHRGELVRKALCDGEIEADAGDDDEGGQVIRFVEQAEQLGTGHAAMMARPELEDDPGRDVFVLAGDGPLIRPQTLRSILATQHEGEPAAATLATAMLDDPSGYGRVIRDGAGQFLRIVEQKDATDAERDVCEVNPSYYCFRCGDLLECLARLSNDNSQGEYYLTDVPALLKANGQRVRVVDAVPPADVLSINTPEQLAEVDRLLRARLSAPSR